MNRAAAFTLLEVLMALLFVGIVGGALAGLFASALRQQHRAAQLEHARAWLQAELGMQYAQASSGPCQSTPTYAKHGWQCTVQLAHTGYVQHAHIVLADPGVTPVRIIGEIWGVAEPR